VWTISGFERATWRSSISGIVTVRHPARPRSKTDAAARTGADLEIHAEFSSASIRAREQRRVITLPIAPKQC